MDVVSEANMVASKIQFARAGSFMLIGDAGI
jgi:hypothetical protein